LPQPSKSPQPFASPAPTSTGTGFQAGTGAFGDSPAKDVAACNAVRVEKIIAPGKALAGEAAARIALPASLGRRAPAYAQYAIASYHATCATGCPARSRTCEPGSSGRCQDASSTETHHGDPATVRPAEARSAAGSCS
jgi:hypothetical protein